MERVKQTEERSFADMSNEELLAEYKRTGDLAVKQEITLRYIYIVKSIALQMKNIYSGFAQLDDIVNEGVIVLMTAVDKFDIEKNVKFSTFVSKRIRGMIIDLARKQDWVPRGVRKNAMELDEASTALYGMLGRPPTDREMADYMGITLEKYEKILKKSNLYYMISLDMIMEESMEKHKTFQISAGDTMDQPEIYYMEKEMQNMLRQGIETLTENEKIVLSLHYIEELSAKDIARVMHVSAPRVSQIHANIIRKLRNYIQANLK